MKAEGNSTITKLCRFCVFFRVCMLDVLENFPESEKWRRTPFAHIHFADSAHASLGAPGFESVQLDTPPHL